MKKMYKAELNNTLPFYFERWRVITFEKGLYFFFSIIMITIASMFVFAKKRNVIHHHLAIESAKHTNRQLNVFFISDIHRRIIDKKLLAKVKQPIDLVIIGGDLAEKGVPTSRISQNIQNLSLIGPIYFIWGNNDREAGESAIRKIIHQVKGKVLDNENCPVPNHPKWGICGTDDPSSRNLDIQKTLLNSEQYEHLIFACHSPAVIQKVPSQVKPRLLLAGHTHGGQIRIGKLGVFEKGSFRVKNGQGTLISNGYGTSTIPLRMGAAPESHVITIHY